MRSIHSNCVQLFVIVVSSLGLAGASLALGWPAVLAATTTAGEPTGPSAAGGLEIQPSDSSIIEPQGLNFAKGTYGTCINGQTFQIDALKSFRGWQYATFFDAFRRLGVARRELPHGAWQRVVFDDYTFKHTDVHNVPVLGICPADGTIHLAFDHHVSPLHYRVSQPRAATDPQATPWRASLFGPTTSELVKGRNLDRLTYPAFVTTPDGRLQLFYRTGGSGDGDTHLALYDPAKGGWGVMGACISGKGDFQGSTSRNAYPNGFDFGPRGRQHMTWVWREGQDNGKWQLLNCHGLQYAFSDDAGQSWQNNAGEVIGTTGREPMHLESPGVTVADIPWRWGIMNQVTQTVDARGQLHVILWQNPPDAAGPARNMNDWRYVHYRRDEQGRWNRQPLPCFGRKPSIVSDQDGNLVLVFTRPQNLEYHNVDPGGPLCIFLASAAADWKDWHQVYQSPQSFVGEPRIDKDRWQQDRILSIYAQESPAEPGKPSALRAIDFVIPRAGWH